MPRAGLSPTAVTEAGAALVDINCGLNDNTSPTTT
jgi:hypothetical protein